MSKKNLSVWTKFSITTFIVALTLGYSLYYRKKVEALTAKENLLILKTLPKFSSELIYKDGAELNEKNLFGKDSAAFIHFWGTWCAPCEAELPEFIDFARKFEGKGVKFVLLAVNDEDKKIKKFMKRFYKNLPTNIVIAHNKDGSSLSSFGTVKVPETYLFNFEGKNLNKFTGPQDWGHKSYFERVNFLLKGIKSLNNAKKVESH